VTSETEKIEAALQRIEATQQAMKLDLQRVVDDLRARPTPAEMQVLLHEHRSRQAITCGAPSFWRGVMGAALATILGNGTLLLLGWLLLVFVKTH
jgi:hypothetical protein